MISYPPERTFQTWEYTRKFRRLYIRSGTGGTKRKNIDVVFLGVHYIDLFHLLHGLEIDSPTPEETSRIQGILGPEVDPAWIRVLVSKEGRSIVVAESMYAQENDFQYFESGVPDPVF